MSYEIKEIESGIVQVSTNGSAAHVFRVLGKTSAHGQILARPSAYGPGPTATTGLAASAAGISPSIVGTDFAGTIIVTNSANGVAGAKAIIVFGEPYANQPYVQISSASATTASALPYVTASTSSFTISTNVVPVASGIETWNYLVLGG